MSTQNRLTAFLLKYIIDGNKTINDNAHRGERTIVYIKLKIKLKLDYSVLFNVHIELGSLIFTN